MPALIQFYGSSLSANASFWAMNSVLPSYFKLFRIERPNFCFWFRPKLLIYLPPKTDEQSVCLDSTRTHIINNYWMRLSMIS